MTTRILLAAALSLGLGTSFAFAQADQNTRPEMATELPENWGPEVNDAFFSDVEAGVLRAEEEVRANWAALTQEQQTQVREHCDTVSGAEAAGSGGTTPENVNSMQQICAWTE